MGRRRQRGSPRRAIDIAEGEEVEASSFKALIREAVALNSVGAKKTPVKKTAAKKKK